MMITMSLADVDGGTPLGGARNGAPDALRRIDSHAGPPTAHRSHSARRSVQGANSGHGFQRNARETPLSQIVAKSARGWSRDGKRIVFAAVTDEHIDAFTVDVESPDGRHLAFISGRDGFDGLYTADADGQHPLRLTATPSLNLEWAPNDEAV
jgi:hypothetical protein